MGGPFDHARGEMPTCPGEPSGALQRPHNLGFNCSVSLAVWRWRDEGIHDPVLDFVTVLVRRNLRPRLSSTCPFGN